MSSFLAFASASLSGALALVIFLQKRQSAPSRFFSIGLIVLAAESILDGISLNADGPERFVYWQNYALVVKSLLPGIWFCFSATYSRGDHDEFLAKWRFLLLAVCVVPVGLSIQYRPDLVRVLSDNESGLGWWLSYSETGMTLRGFLLIGSMVILMNLERTFRAAVGTMRWRIKFLVLGVGVIFGARIYTGTQALLFSRHNSMLLSVEAGALLIGCALMAVAYFRSGGYSEIDVYPSRAVLQTSLTVLLVGGYLFAVGVLAQVVARFGGARSFPAQAFLILTGIVLLAVVLLSDKMRQRVQEFVSRNFKRPQHDFRKVWTHFTGALSGVHDQSGLCAAAARIISETFNALSVTIWLLDEHSGQLTFAASTSAVQGIDDKPAFSVGSSDAAKLQKLSRAFDLETPQEDWAESLRKVSSGLFTTGGHRICVPLRTGERLLGVAILADRVNGIPYTVEELDLLECIADQVTATLLNLRLTAENLAARELEAFQTISAFFVHDLKNAASTLSLMLKNLPVHFDDPSFRKDALRGIGTTANHINQLIHRLGALRHKLELKPDEVDLNILVEEAVARLNGTVAVQWVKQLNPLPKLMADREQIQSVITNLLLNARDAVETSGVVTVETSERDGCIVLSVADNGCGMSREFLESSLFRPFQTTKKKGLGIGMFQSKIIMEAHGGKIQVNSEPGVGTTFRVMLPLASQPK